MWLPALALGGIALAVISLAWLRIRLGLDASSLRQKGWVLWRAYRRRQRDKGSAKTRRQGGTRTAGLTRKPAYADVWVEVDD